ncbi:hypothetical protein NN561_017684 [Cricetulus griseus]
MVATAASPREPLLQAAPTQSFPSPSRGGRTHLGASSPAFPLTPPPCLLCGGRRRVKAQGPRRLGTGAPGARPGRPTAPPRGQCCKPRCDDFGSIGYLPPAPLARLQGTDTYWISRERRPQVWFCNAPVAAMGHLLELVASLDLCLAGSRSGCLATNSTWGRMGETRPQAAQPSN